MRVCLLDRNLTSVTGQALVNEARILHEEGAEVTVISGGSRHDAERVLPEGCRWIGPDAHAIGRRSTSMRGRYLIEAIRADADAYHAHTTKALMFVAYWTAVLKRKRFFGDFNDIVLLLRSNEEPVERASQTTFDEAGHWEQPQSESETSRLETTMQMIPDDVASVLDVGCGDGRLTNRLSARFDQVIGLDPSSTALSFVKAPAQAVVGSAEALPFSDQSFDLVVSTECIEHLPPDIYGKALTEIQRVARKYIVIGVPLEEQLAAKNMVCVHDGCRFNVNGHFRNFMRGQFADLFAEFHERRIMECGSSKRFCYHPLLLWIKQRIGGIWARVPYSICPKCGRNLEPTGVSERNAVGRWCDTKNLKYREKMESRLTQSHIVVLYERR